MSEDSKPAAPAKKPPNPDDWLAAIAQKSRWAMDWAVLGWLSVKCVELDLACIQLEKLKESGDVASNIASIVEFRTTQRWLERQRDKLVAKLQKGANRMPGILAGILGSSARAFAAWWFWAAQGAANIFTDVVDRVLARFRSFSHQQALDAASEGLESRRAGARMERIGAAARLNDKGIPIDPTIPRRYRYVVTIEVLEDPNDPRSESLWRTVVVNSEESLTSTQLKEAAQDLFEGQFCSGVGSAPIDPALCQFVLKYHVNEVVRKR